MSKLKHLKENKKKIAPVILLAIIISGASYNHWGRAEIYTGMVESVVVTNPAEAAGKIIESNISLGQKVKAGDVIAVIDSADLEYALEQLELNLEKAYISHEDALTGESRTSNSVAAMRATVRGAEATANQAAQDYQKSLTLFQNNAIAESALEAARAQLAAAVNNSADSLTSSSNVDIQLLESKISQQKAMIKKCTMIAGCDGIIISRNFGLGDFVAPGYNIADIASTNEMYVVFYFPKERVSEISYDDRILFSYGKNNSEHEAYGTVKFIDVKPQYTPRDFQTPANKNKESVKIKLLIPEGSAAALKPGDTVRIDGFGK